MVFLCSFEVHYFFLFKFELLKYGKLELLSFLIPPKLACTRFFIKFWRFEFSNFDLCFFPVYSTTLFLLTCFNGFCSEETRVKIGVGVRMGWQRRREKRMLQETCYFEWQNLIAEASRRGYAGEEELQWDSYKILDEQLEREWLESVEERKKMPRPKGSKRAPKSPEQRRKISEAISAKWSDPVRTYNDILNCLENSLAECGLFHD